MLKSQISGKYLHWEPSCSMQMDGTDRHDEANSRFLRFCERSWNHRVSKMGSIPVCKWRSSFLLGSLLHRIEYENTINRCQKVWIYSAEDINKTHYQNAVFPTLITRKINKIKILLKTASSLWVKYVAVGWLLNWVIICSILSAGI
jgi:hypothetical protein